MLAIRTILHPTDFSDRSDAAFRLACALARDHGARLLVLHVVEPASALSAEAMMILPSPEEQEQARERLRSIRPADRKLRVRHLLARGDAATQILETAEKRKCDTIVLGTHGRTGLNRLVMGSVAEQVVRKAHCPVVTVKSPVPLPGVAGERIAASATPQPAGQQEVIPSQS